MRGRGWRHAEVIQVIVTIIPRTARPLRCSIGWDPGRSDSSLVTETARFRRAHAADCNLAAVVSVVGRPEEIPELGEWLRDLRRAGRVIEAHPLGFLRLPLTDLNRLMPGFYLHVWPAWPGKRQDVDSEVHCHVFDLESEILVGALTNKEFEVQADPTGEYEVLEAQYDGALSHRLPTQRRVHCAERSSLTYVAGDRYWMARGTYHLTLVLHRPTVTLMRKYNVDDSLHPLNLRRAGQAVSGPASFDHSQLDQERAWSTVFESLAEIGL